MWLTSCPGSNELGQQGFTLGLAGATLQLQNSGSACPVPSGLQEEEWPHARSPLQPSNLNTRQTISFLFLRPLLSFSFSEVRGKIIASNTAHIISKGMKWEFIHGFQTRKPVLKKKKGPESWLPSVPLYVWCMFLCAHADGYECLYRWEINTQCLPQFLSSLFFIQGLSTPSSAFQRQSHTCSVQTHMLMKTLRYIKWCILSGSIVFFSAGFLI